jgi:ABC-type glycerol-3-phosphate transport system substrate-binding protein
MTKSLDMFILQAGADIYKDDGEHIAYGEDTQLDAFTTMTEFFTLYTLPMTIDSTNRFRTGEAPIIVADLVGFYNQFTAFATELKGLWSFSNVPGTVREDGTIDRSNVLAVTSLIIMKDAATRGTDAAAFKFIEWWTRTEVQSSYANELIAVIGNAAKYNTANVEAYLEMDWSARESKIIMNEIFPNIVGVPDMPGSYIIGRYVNFAFLAAYNDKASPSDKLLSYIGLIDKEFERKREELSREFFIPAEDRFQAAFAGSWYSDARNANA